MTSIDDDDEDDDDNHAGDNGDGDTDAVPIAMMAIYMSHRGEQVLL